MTCEICKCQRRCPWAAGPGRAHQNHRHRRCGGCRRDRRARASCEAGPGCGARGRRVLAGHTRTTGTAGVEGAGGSCRRAGGRWRGLAATPVGGGAWPGTPEPQAPPVWRVPEGPESTGKLRGGAWLRCPWAAGPSRAHQNHRHRRCGGRRRKLPPCRWAVAGPGRASRRRAERSSRRGRLAGGPPPTGTHSGRARRRPEHQRHHNHRHNHSHSHNHRHRHDKAGRNLSVPARPRC